MGVPVGRRGSRHGYRVWFRRRTGIANRRNSNGRALDDCGGRGNANAVAVSVADDARFTECDTDAHTASDADYACCAQPDTH